MKPNVFCVPVGYTVIAFTQTIESSFSSSGHVNYLEEAVRRLKKREGVMFLKRLTILLDDASEKGTGLVSCFRIYKHSKDM